VLKLASMSLKGMRRKQIEMGESMARNNPPNCPFPILGLFLALWLLEGCGALTASSSGGSPNQAPTPSSV